MATESIQSKLARLRKKYPGSGRIPADIVQSKRRVELNKISALNRHLSVADKPMTQRDWNKKGFEVAQTAGKPKPKDKDKPTKPWW